MKTIYVLLAFLICTATASFAQSGSDIIPSNFLLNVGEEAYQAEGAVFTMEMTNIAEELYLMTLMVDQMILEENLKISVGELMNMQIGPPEKNNDGVKTFSQNDIVWGDGGLTVEHKNGKVIVSYDDDTITLVWYTNADGTITIKSQPKTGEAG